LNKVLLPNFDGHCSTEIFPIKVSKDILREYLFYWFRLQRTVEAINETCTGARMPRANMEAVLEFEIPLPAIEIQREIVEKLDNTFTEIETLKAQIKVGKDYVVALRQSLLSSAFTQEEAVA
jgi:type I restriction enzyme S subunit